MKLEAELSKSQTREKRLGQLLEEALVVSGTTSSRGWRDRIKMRMQMMHGLCRTRQAQTLTRPCWSLPHYLHHNYQTMAQTTRAAKTRMRMIKWHNNQLDEISTSENSLQTSLLVPNKDKQYEVLERHHEASLQENKRLSGIIVSN